MGQCRTPRFLLTVPLNTHVREAMYIRETMNYLLAITYIFIFLDPLLPRNPKDGVDGGSIPTFDEKVPFLSFVRSKL